MLAGSRVVLGVTGGIAAYKAVEVCRRLVDAGAHVAPVMTAGPRAGSSARPRCPPWRRSRCARRSGTRRSPSRTPVWARGPTSSWSARPRRGCSPTTPPAARPTSSPPPCSPPGLRWWSARPCTPRCGSTRRCRTTWPRCGHEGSGSWSPSRAASPAATSGHGRLAAPERIVAAVEACLAARPTSPGSRSWSPPAAPARRSTPSASSGTARRASRATPSPRRRCAAAPRSP